VYPSFLLLSILFLDIWFVSEYVSKRSRVLGFAFDHVLSCVLIFLFLFNSGPPKALDEDEMEFLDKLASVSILIHTNIEFPCPG
jgi:hypothetical protein